MSDDTILVSIHILGKEYRIGCRKEERDILLESARFLDERMREVKRKGSVIGAERIAVLVALNLASEVLQHQGGIASSITSATPESGNGKGDSPEKEIEPEDPVKRRIRAMQLKIESAIEEARPFI